MAYLQENEILEAVRAGKCISSSVDLNQLLKGKSATSVSDCKLQAHDTLIEAFRRIKKDFPGKVNRVVEVNAGEVYRLSLVEDISDKISLMFRQLLECGLNEPFPHTVDMGALEQLFAFLSGIVPLEHPDDCIATCVFPDELLEGDNK